MIDENLIMHQLLEIFEYKSEYQASGSAVAVRDLHVLEKLIRAGLISFGSLAVLCEISPSTLTGIVDRLENKKLIGRLRSADDRRSVLLRPTDAGRQLVDQHLAEDRLFSANLFGVLPPAKRDQLLALLQELAGSVDKSRLFEQADRKDELTCVFKKSD